MRKKLFGYLLICIFTLCVTMFSACDQTVNVSLSVQKEYANGIQMNLDDEPLSFDVTINNYYNGFSSELKYDFTDPIAKVETTTIKHEGNGVVSAKITPISGGTTTLRVSTYQSNKYIDIPVTIVEPIKSITVKNGINMFVLKAQETTEQENIYDETKENVLKFNSESLFDYKPEFTKQRDVLYNFYINAVTTVSIRDGIIKCVEENGTTYIVFLNDKGEKQKMPVNASKFTIQAVSQFKTEVVTTFDVVITNKIDIQKIILNQIDNLQAEPKIISANTINGVVNNIENPIPVDTFVRNDGQYYQHNFQLIIEHTDIFAEITTQNGLFLPEITSIKEKEISQTIDGQAVTKTVTEVLFNLQSTNVGQDKLKIKIYPQGFDGYNHILEYNLTAIEKPTGLLINDLLSNISLTLYTGKDVQPENINLSVFPNVEDYEISLKFYKDANCEEEYTIADVKRYIELTHNERALFNSDGSSVYTLKKSDLFAVNGASIPLMIKPLAAGNIFVKFTATITDEVLNKDFEISNVLPVIIKQGATLFEVNQESKYPVIGKIPVLYIPLNGSAEYYDFNDFVIKSGQDDITDIGAMTFSATANDYKNIGISQLEENGVLTKTIRLVPKQEGESKITIILKNGISCDVIISVINTYKNFTLGLSDTNQYVASLKTDTNLNISEITVRNPNYKSTPEYKGNQNIALKLAVQASSQVYYDVKWSAGEESKITFDTANVLIPKMNVNALYAKAQKVSVTFKYRDYQNFKLIEPENELKVTHEFGVLSFASINSINFYLDKNVLYRENTLNYFALTKKDNIATITAKIDPDVTETDKDYEEQHKKVRNEINFTFSKSYLSNYITSTKTNRENGYIINVVDYGEFSFNSETGEYTFNYNSSSQNISDTLYIYATYTEYDKTISAYTSINLKDYINVSSISLSNYLKEIYLDSVRNTQVIFPVVGPTNAISMEYRTQFVVTEGNPNIAINSDDASKIILSFTNLSEGGKGYLYLIPTSSYESESNYNYAFRIPVVVADGSYEYPIRISSTEEFMQINTPNGLTKHYELSGEINLAGKNLCFGTFSGTIRGSQQGAVLKNVEINSAINGNAGIFQTIKKYTNKSIEVPTVSNITIEAKINGKFTDTNVGVLCGTNEGLIKNVSVELSKSTIDISAESEMGIGGLVGKNNGTIVIEQNDSVDKTTLVNMNEKFSVVILTENTNVLAKTLANAYTGGVVGVNNGTIKTTNTTTRNINRFGYTSFVDVQSIVTAGGVVGLNFGLVSTTETSKKMFVGGNIVMTGSANNINNAAGGIVGFNKIKDSSLATVTNGNSRVFIQSNKHVAGIVGYSEGGVISNNIVEAIYNDLNQPLLIKYDEAGNNKIQPIYSGNVNTSNNNNSISYREGYDMITKISSNEVSGNGEFTKVNIANFVAKQVNMLEYYYEALEKYIEYVDGEGNKKYQDNQKLLDINNNLINLPFEIDSLEAQITNNLQIRSKSTDIVSVLNNGKLQIKSTGIAQLELISLLDTRKTTNVNLHIVNKVDGFKFYLSADRNQNDVLPNNTTILVSSTNNTTIYYGLYANEVEIDSYKIKLVEPISNNLKVNLEYVFAEGDTENIEYIKFDQYPGRFVFSKNNDNQGVNQLASKLQYIYGTVNLEVKSNNEQIVGTTLKVKHRIGATNIQSDVDTITAYPTQIVSQNVVLTTNEEEDNLSVKVYDENGDEVSSDVLLWTISKDSETETTKSYKMTFELIEKERNGTYTVKYTANNGLSKTVEITFLLQPISNISVNVYSNYDKNSEGIVVGVSSVVEPGIRTNHIVLFVEPGYADYDYIDVTNSLSNYVYGSQALFVYIEGNSDYIMLDNGIRIYKSSSSLHVIRFAISSSAENDTNFGLNFIAYRKQQVIYSSSKTLRVKEVAEVKVSFSGRPTEEINYVAVGKDYNLGVNRGKYNAEDITVYLSDSSIGTIIKQNENYILRIYNSAKQSSAFIYAYGTSTVDGKRVNGPTSSLELRVTDFLLSGNAIKVDETSFSLPIGTFVVIEDEMLNGLQLEYNQEIAAIQTAVDNFIKEVKTKSKLYLGVYDTTTSIYNYTQLNKETKVYENTYFKLTYEDNTGWKLVPKKILPINNYCFKMEFGVSYGAKTEMSLTGAIQGSIIKNVEITNNSSLENPIPISNYEEFLKMQDGLHYMQIADITFPSVSAVDAFSPLDVQVASYNGNNYKINLSSMELSELVESDGTSSNVSIASVGLFKTIKKGSIIQNVNVHIKNNIVISLDKRTSTTTYVGLIAGTNEGIITNCYATCESGVRAKVEIGGTDEHYFGGLVGNNKGYITNSRMMANIGSNTHLGGLVGINAKHVSSCYVKGANITNIITGSVNASEQTAGFAVTNTGMIRGSYVSGSYSFANLFYADVNSVSSSLRAAGFVYTNTGNVEDSYSNIKVDCSSEGAGFVMVNNGEIIRCYSTSKLKDNNANSFPFHKSLAAETSIFEDCFYSTDINNKIYVYAESNLLSGLKGITNDKFYEETELLFKNYVLADKNSKNKTDYTWFYPADNGDVGFESLNVSFKVGRPELVQANIKSYSQYKLIETTYDETTGEAIYTYSDDTYEYASALNPIVVYNAEQLEKVMLETNKQTLGITRKNASNIRLVCDIEYADEILTNIFSTVFTGSLEGNGLTVSGYSVNTGKSLNNGGFFSQIGTETEKGSIRNVSFIPKYMNMPNTNCVGVVAGASVYAVLNNVFTSADFIVNGKNIAGGVIGKATQHTYMENVGSSVSVGTTSFIVEQENDIDNKSQLYDETTNQIEKVSYAGGIAGVFSGTLSNANRVKITAPITIFAKMAGFMFGGITDNAVVNDIALTLTDEFSIKSYGYVGMIAGHCSGKIQDCIIQEKDKENTLTDIVKVEPLLPMAIGGVVGYSNPNYELVETETETETEAEAETKTKKMIPEFDNGFTYQNIYNSVDIISTKCKIVGGFIGKMLSASFSECKVEANVQGVSSVGGFVGMISDYTDNVEDQVVGIAQVKNAAMNIDGNKPCYFTGKVNITNIAVHGEAKNKYAFGGGFVGNIFVQDFYYNEISSNLIRISAPKTKETPLIQADIYSSNQAVTTYLGGFGGVSTISLARGDDNGSDGLIHFDGGATDIDYLKGNRTFYPAKQDGIIDEYKESMFINTPQTAIIIDLIDGEYDIIIENDNIENDNKEVIISGDTITIDYKALQLSTFNILSYINILDQSNSDDLFEEGDGAKKSAFISLLKITYYTDIYCKNKTETNISTKGINGEKPYKVGTYWLLVEYERDPNNSDFSSYRSASSIFKMEVKDESSNYEIKISFNKISDIDDILDENMDVEAHKNVRFVFDDEIDYKVFLGSQVEECPGNYIIKKYYGNTKNLIDYETDSLARSIRLRSVTYYIQYKLINTESGKIFDSNILTLTITNYSYNSGGGGYIFLPDPDYITQ